MDDIEQTQEAEIPLAEMIETLRQELEGAQKMGVGRPIAFGIEKVELELKVALSRKGKVGGGIKFWVISTDGSAEGSKETIHTFKLTLSPLDAETEKRLKISGKTKTLNNEK
jgi:hypothetical protein